jgi:isoamylase
VIGIMKENPVLCRRRFLYGRRIRGSEIKDISWFSSKGREMSDKEWNAEHVRTLGVRLAGDAIEEVDRLGRPIAGDSLLILLNAHHETVPFLLPAHRKGTWWELMLDTATDGNGGRNRIARGGRTYSLQDRSLAVFRLVSREKRSGD